MKKIIFICTMFLFFQLYGKSIEFWRVSKIIENKMRTFCLYEATTYFKIKQYNWDTLMLSNCDQNGFGKCKKEKNKYYGTIKAKFSNSNFWYAGTFPP